MIAATDTGTTSTSRRRIRPTLRKHQSLLYLLPVLLPVLLVVLTAEFPLLCVEGDPDPDPRSSTGSTGTSRHYYDPTFDTSNEQSTTTTTTTTATTDRNDQKNDKEGDSEYYVGIASYDMTGPAAEMFMMGYATLSQTTQGIHQRLYARAYIIGQQQQQQQQQQQSVDTPSLHTPSNENSDWYIDSGTRTSSILTERHIRNRNRHRLVQMTENDSKGNHEHCSDNEATNVIDLNPNTTICFVSVDIGMGSDLLNIRVLRRLDDLIQQLRTTGSGDKNTTTGSGSNSNSNTSSDPPTKRQSPCRIENLSISATHTHSAPGGYFQYALYQVPTLGYTDEVVHAYAEGIAQAIFMAYQNLESGTTIRTAQSWLIGANRNRSPTSYQLNPETERDEYKEEGDTDKTMTQVTFHSTGDDNNNNNNMRGLLNWFAVHGTSMNSSNHLISGDNKGYASYLMERYWNGGDTLPGTGNFVAAFASTNLGDVSPNTAGPHCIDTGVPCDDGITNSTCNGNCNLCRSTGPGADMFESTEIIGRLQYEHALNLTKSTLDQQQLLHGDVSYRHSFIDISNLTVVLPNNTVVHTCPAAFGYAFAAGTTDGPGQYPFEQGTNTTNPLYNMIGGFLSIPTAEQVQCQAPKPILFNVGKTTFPYRWIPSIVPISIFRIGQMFILNVPAEFTTMAGRRLRKAVHQSLHEVGFDDQPIIVIAGLANSYTNYVTTMEEYTGQRYEAASTLYGPYTLDAYVQEFRRLLHDLMAGNNSTTTEGPRDLSRHLVSDSTYPSLLSIDTIGVGRKFGSLVTDTKEAYRFGETVSALFRSANPRNNVRSGGTFLTVDLLNETDGTWQTRYVDDDWCTKYHWKGGWSNDRFYWGNSFANITWTVPEDTPHGMYRICHNGTRQTILGAVWLNVRFSSAGFISVILGLQPVSLVIHILNAAYHISDTLRESVRNFKIGKKKDFHGCSQTFLVH